MPRMIAAVLLLLFTMGQAVAGPPEKASGKMVLDEVAEGIRTFQKETDVEKRIRSLKRLAPTRDKRVAVVLQGTVLLTGEADLPLALVADDLLSQYYDPFTELPAPRPISLILARNKWPRLTRP